MPAGRGERRYLATISPPPEGVGRDAQCPAGLAEGQPAGAGGGRLLLRRRPISDQNYLNLAPHWISALRLTGSGSFTGCHFARVTRLITKMIPPATAITTPASRYCRACLVETGVWPDVCGIALPLQIKRAPKPRITRPVRKLGIPLIVVGGVEIAKISGGLRVSADGHSSARS